MRKCVAANDTTATVCKVKASVHATGSPTSALAGVRYVNREKGRSGSAVVQSRPPQAPSCRARQALLPNKQSPARRRRTQSIARSPAQIGVARVALNQGHSHHCRQQAKTRQSWLGTSRTQQTSDCRGALAACWAVQNEVSRFFANLARSKVTAQGNGKSYD